MKRIHLLLALLLLFAACSGSEQTDHLSSRPDFDQIPVFEPQELYTISTFDDNQFFGYVNTVLVSDDHTIFVSDLRNLKIYLFDQTGNYTGYLGGNGDGPGEFRQIGAVTLITPDTLQVVDWQLARITLFTKQEGQWAPAIYFERPDGPKEYGSDIFFVFNSLHPHPDGYLARFHNSFTPVDSASYGFAYYSLFDFDMNPVNSHEYLMHVNNIPAVSRVQGRSVSVMTLPESQKTLYANTSDGYKISTWTGSNVVTIRQITGDDSTGFRFPSRHVLFTEDEITEVVESRIPDPANSGISREQLRETLPEYKGYSRQLILDDEERIWILAMPFEEDDPEWLAYNKNGDLLAAATHPGGTVTQIKGNRMYVNFTSGDEEPAFGVFELRE